MGGVLCDGSRHAEAEEVFFSGGGAAVEKQPGLGAGRPGSQRESITVGKKGGAFSCLGGAKRIDARRDVRDL